MNDDYVSAEHLGDYSCFSPCIEFHFESLPDEDFNLENVIKNVMLSGHRSIIDTFLAGPLNSPKNLITGYNSDCGAGQGSTNSIFTWTI